LNDIRITIPARAGISFLKTNKPPPRRRRPSEFQRILMELVGSPRREQKRFCAGAIISTQSVDRCLNSRQQISRFQTALPSESDRKGFHIRATLRKSGSKPLSGFLPPHRWRRDTCRRSQQGRIIGRGETARHCAVEVASRRRFVHTHSHGADARKSVPLILNLVTEGEIIMFPIAHRAMPFSLLAAA
jgi:hypothetical protein